MNGGEVRPAFTLLEVIVALALSALLLVGGRLLFEQLALAGETVRRESTRADQVANGSRLLRALLATAEMGPDTTQLFTGNEMAMTLATWCEVPAGWVERCLVHLGLTTKADSTTLAASFGGNTAVKLWTARGPAHFRYFGLTGSSLGWVKSWGGSIALPLAVSIAPESAGDTILMPVGAAP